jgi:hypothetical protein
MMLIASSPQGLPFQKVAHKVATLDAQPAGDSGIVILVTGHLLVGDTPYRERNWMADRGM